MRFDFSLAASARPPLRAAIDALTRAPEADCVARLIAGASLDDSALVRVRADASRLVETLRTKRSRSGGVDALMREFSLSSDEGVALMCLAEALLRIPDQATRDALVRDKIGGGDWNSHVGQSPSLFVNAAAWGLVVTGKLVSTHSARGLSASLTRIVARGGEPLIRKGVDLAMRMLGRQFVTGETIEDAIDNGRDLRRRGYRYSYDMLGEAAMTAGDAARYLASYEHAIEAIGTSAEGATVRERAGISIKLSALHPRYSRATRERVLAELLPVVKNLAFAARRHRIGLNIDAEESERLDISLDLLEALAGDPDLDDWDGLGFVIQAYSKRAPAVIAFVADLSRRTRGRTERTMMVRLVKGAYWDSEIKRAQVEGQDGYPVYTRKAHTDVAYQACACALLAAADAIYPQFATHNAYTLAWVRETARRLGVAEDRYEFQCLHGMGETLYDQIVGAQSTDPTPLSCRIYAPVGSHETLLAYLVRRLLENGANTSFVNRIVDARVPIGELVADPVAHALQTGGSPHPAIPLPVALYPDGRINSRGFDVASEAAIVAMSEALAPFADRQWTFGAGQEVLDPADRDDVVGTIAPTPADSVGALVERARSVASTWLATAPSARAAVLRRCADLLEVHRVELIALAIREAGKTFGNAIGEVREAIDFCRYYAGEIVDDPVSAEPASGPLVCISPWNFPLAIFSGQVVGALAAGRCVIAKPAEQTPLIAARAVALFHEAGVPADVLQLAIGDGAIGAALVAHPVIAGVLFTGSTEVARSIAKTLARRDDDPILVAETGGQNALIVDSSALTEQVVGDAIVSAFDSAGQRCSALRILCLQDAVYDHTLAMLLGALAELAVGDPLRWSTDIGPAIDAEARDRLVAHVDAMRAKGHRVHAMALPAACANGTFVAPTIIEIDRIADIPGEVFGPILHVLRWRFGELDRLIAGIDATGYGLTMGVHSRIDEHIGRVAARAHVGNLYVNRTLIGATVGVQPFGGEGLSGTGPKAGGPFYLARLDARRGARRFVPDTHAVPRNLASLRDAIARSTTFDEQARRRLDAHCVQAEAAAAELTTMRLPGPTGETNTLALRPRRRIACLADDPFDLACQVIAAQAVGAKPAATVERLPEPLRSFVESWDGDPQTLADLDALLVALPADERRRTKAACAARPGPIVAIVPWDRATAPVLGLWRLMHEFAESVNTAAAGGNASLMTLADA